MCLIRPVGTTKEHYKKPHAIDNNEVFTVQSLVINCKKCSLFNKNNLDYFRAQLNYLFVSQHEGFDASRYTRYIYHPRKCA